MDKINKLSLPATILIASVVLGGFYYASEVNKQTSIERQHQAELQAKKDEANAVSLQLSRESAQKASCVTEAQITAVDLYESGSMCDGSLFAPAKNCKDGVTYNVNQYNNAYNTCLQSKGLK